MPILILLLQCVAMFAASFLVGSLPLFFRSASSGKRLKAVSVFGMGILVGAALTIIIPEGVSTLYESLPSNDRGGHVQAVGISLLTGFALMLLIESLTPHPPHDDPGETASIPDDDLSLDGRNSDEPGRPSPRHLDSATPILPKQMHVEDPESQRGFIASLQNHKSARRGMNALLGLVIHGLADGIALGASSLSDRSSLGVIVFLAVLVHKGPTALGLTTTLLSLSFTPPMIRKCLVIFSFAAPVGALVSYALVRAFGHNFGGTLPSDAVDGIGWWTGIALLFSGGSFLYVATVIQPLSEPHPHQHSHSGHSQAETDRNDQSQALGTYARTILLVIGMLLPVLLSLVVGEDH